MLEEEIELNAKLQDVYTDIYNMRVELERTRKPLGTRDNPVRTCRDLFYGHPHFKDGTCCRTLTKAQIFNKRNTLNLKLTDWYWVDPNLGMPDDAIYVFCNLTNGGETCVLPETKTTRLPLISWGKHPDSKKKEVWFSSFHQGFRVGRLEKFNL